MNGIESLMQGMHAGLRMGEQHFAEGGQVQQPYFNEFGDQVQHYAGGGATTGLNSTTGGVASDPVQYRTSPDGKYQFGSDGSLAVWTGTGFQPIPKIAASDLYFQDASKQPGAVQAEDGNWYITQQIGNGDAGDSRTLVNNSVSYASPDVYNSGKYGNADLGNTNNWATSWDPNNPDSWNLKLKSADKEGTNITYTLKDGYWVPQVTGTEYWDTNNSQQNMALLTMAAMAAGGYFLGPMLGAGEVAAEGALSAADAFALSDAVYGASQFAYGMVPAEVASAAEAAAAATLGATSEEALAAGFTWDAAQGAWIAPTTTITGTAPAAIGAGEIAAGVGAGAGVVNAIDSPYAPGENPEPYTNNPPFEDNYPTEPFENNYPPPDAPPDDYIPDDLKPDYQQPPEPPPKEYPLPEPPPMDIPEPPEIPTSFPSWKDAMNWAIKNPQAALTLGNAIYGMIKGNEPTTSTTGGGGGGGGWSGPLPNSQFQAVQTVTPAPENYRPGFSPEHVYLRTSYVPGDPLHPQQINAAAPPPLAPPPDIPPPPHYAQGGIVALATGGSTNMKPALWSRDWIIGQTPEGYDIYELPNQGGSFIATPDNTIWKPQYDKYGTDPLPKDAMLAADGKYYNHDEWVARNENIYEQLAPGASIWTTAEDGTKYRSGSNSDLMRAAGWYSTDGGWYKNGISENDAIAAYQKGEDPFANYVAPKPTAMTSQNTPTVFSYGVNSDNMTKAFNELTGGAYGVGPTAEGVDVEAWKKGMTDAGWQMTGDKGWTKNGVPLMDAVINLGTSYQANFPDTYNNWASGLTPNGTLDATAMRNAGYVQNADGSYSLSPYLQTSIGSGYYQQGPQPAYSPTAAPTGTAQPTNTGGVTSLAPTPKQPTVQQPQPTANYAVQPTAVQQPGITALPSARDSLANYQQPQTPAQAQGPMLHNWSEPVTPGAQSMMDPNLFGDQSYFHYMNPGNGPGYAGGGHVQGQGDGTSDSVPANIEGQQQAALSKDEFVVPADVVADLGNGSSEAGAQVLYAMMERIRQARHGTKQQPPDINPEDFLPA